MTKTKPLLLLLGLAALSACQSPSPTQPAIAPPITTNTATPPSTTPATSGKTAPGPSAQPAALAKKQTLIDEPSRNDALASNNLDTKSAAAPAAFSVNRPQATGKLQHPELTEVSGLAASTRSSDVLWAINDSGNDAKLYALNQQGESLGSFKVAANNRDWEDLASAWINGESYLLIGDIGDNLTSKDEHAIHIIVEPLLDGQPVDALVPIHTLRFRYPDGAHNSESLTFADGWVYILSKESLRDGTQRASQVYRVPLSFADTNQLVLAEKIAALAVPSFSFEARLIAALTGVDISQPTAFDIDRHNRHAYVLTYRDIYRYTREHEMNWADVLAKPRTRVHRHSLSQAEALAVSENGVVWFTSEKTPAPLWALPAAK